MTFSIHGLGVSRGIAIGHVHMAPNMPLDVHEYRIEKTRINSECARLQAAIRLASEQLQALKKRLDKDMDPGSAEFIIDTYLLVLNDKLLLKEPAKIIAEQLCNAEWAVKLFRDNILDTFDKIEEPYLRTRRDDIFHVLNQVLHALIDPSALVDQSPDSQLRDHIVIKKYLSPEDILLFQSYGVLAFAACYGSPNAHASIIAKSMGIPCVVGLHQVYHYIRNDELVILDGSRGVLLVDVNSQILSEYKKRIRQEKRYQRSLQSFRKNPTRTADGQPITLMANIELASDFSTVTRIHADGVGLYRTEYLFMNRQHPPDEEEQYRGFSKAVKRLAGLPLTIRTLDLTAGKLAYLRHQTNTTENDSAMGLRSIRLCLHEPGLFEPHLRAILRASAHGPIRLLLPMLTNLQEVAQVLDLIRGLQQELRNRHVDYDETMPVGAMVEVPATALCAKHFARKFDFLSIGTNDLIQFCLAADRENDRVSYLYDPLHPALIRLLGMTIRAGEKASIPVMLCGEMAGEVQYTRLLLAIGLREFSVGPSNLLEIRKIINSSKLDELTRARGRIKRASTAVALKKLLGEINSGLELG